MGELILPSNGVPYSNTLVLLPPKLVFWDTSDGIQDRDIDNNTIHFVNKVNQYVSVVRPRKFSCLYDHLNGIIIIMIIQIIILL